VLKVEPAELIIAGEGPEMVRLNRAAADLPVSFIGVLPDPRSVADFLRTIDLLVLPSRHEGLPNVVLEALACGVPVVATDVPGIAEAAAGHTRLVPPDDPSKLAAAVIDALGVPAHSFARPFIQSFGDVAAQHLRAFQDAVEGRRRGLGATTPEPATLAERPP
jgi:glycosyltransferase involved in cell wall biosynthesis